MTGRRFLLSFAAIGAALGLQASCVAVFGVDEASLHDVVIDMCKCDALQGLDGCVATLTERLDGAGGAAQEAWLARYVKTCTQCGDVLACLSESPTCTLSTCKIDAECCQTNAAGPTTCKAGACKECSVGSCTVDADCCPSGDAGKVKCVVGFCN